MLWNLIDWNQLHFSPNMLATIEDIYFAIVIEYINQFISQRVGIAKIGCLVNVATDIYFGSGRF